LLVGCFTETLATQIRRKRGVWTKREVTGSVPFLEPTLKIENSSVSFELKLNVASRGHRLFPSKSDKLIKRNTKVGVAVSGIIPVAFPGVTHAQLHLIITGWHLDQPLANTALLRIRVGDWRFWITRQEQREQWQQHEET
jgi:hypothetical protein